MAVHFLIPRESWGHLWLTVGMCGLFSTQLDALESERTPRQLASDTARSYGTFSMLHTFYMIAHTFG